MISRRQGKRAHWSALSLLLVLALVMGSRTNALLEPLDFALYDAFVGVQASAEPNTNVAVVAIDEKAIEEWGHPVPDEVLATLLGKIEAAGARVIGLDLYRDRIAGGPSSPLYQVLEASDRIIGAMLFAPGSERDVAPPAPLVERDLYGSVNAPTDADTQVRRMLLYVGDGTRTVPSFALRTALRFLEEEDISPRIEIETRRSVVLGAARLDRLTDAGGPYGQLDTGGYQILAGFPRELAAFPIFEAHSVVDGSSDLSVLGDRAVLVGTISETVTDRIATPLRHVDGNPITVGVLLNASHVDELISVARGERGVKWFLSFWREFVLIAVLVLLLGLLQLVATHLWIVGLSGAVATAAVVGAGYMLHSYDLVLPTGRSSSRRAPSPLPPCPCATAGS